MESTGRQWTVEEILAELGDTTIFARNERAEARPLPARLDPGCRQLDDPGWEAESLHIHDTDKAVLARVWWDALEKPGQVHETVLRREWPEGWRRAQVKILDVRHQPEFGVVLVGSTDLGPCAPPATTSRERGATPGDDGAAHFERPLWVLQELDDVGRVLNSEGDVRLILGRDPEEIVGEPVLRSIHPEDHVACLQMWSSLLADPGSSRTIRQRVLRPDGTVRWIESTVLNRMREGGEGAVLSITHDITERRGRERDLQRRALTDPLTGLPNRFALDSDLQDMLEGGVATALFLDLDGFKRVNDSLGHLVGDEVLEALGQRLRRGLPAGTVAGRWGGDEFVLIAPGDRTDELHEAVRRAFADPISVADGLWHPACSFGTAVGTCGANPDALIRSADTAMYRAKEQRPH